MKFVLAKEYRFWWPVKVYVPDEANVGQFAEQVFEGQFVAIDQKEAEELNDRWKACKTDKDRRKQEHALIRRAMIGWRNVDDPDGTPVPFSDEALDEMLGLAFVRLGIYRAYFEALAGEAREKN